jgi:hypothetical protein
MVTLTKEQYLKLLQDYAYRTPEKTPRRAALVMALKHAKECECGCGGYIVELEPNAPLVAKAYLDDAVVNASKADI